MQSEPRTYLRSEKGIDSRHPTVLASSLRKSPRTLQWFLIVAGEKDLRQAALRCGMTQRDLRVRIASLESEQACRLFHIYAKQISLTRAGRSLLDSVILHRVDAPPPRQLNILIDRAAGKSIPAWVASLARNLFPGVRVSIRTGRLSAKATEIHMRTIDLALLYGLPTSAGSGIAYQSLFDDPLVLLLSTAHRLAQSKSARLEDLREEQWFYPSPACMPYIHDILAWETRRAGFCPSRALLARSVPLVDAVGAGVGISVVPSGFLHHCPSTVTGVRLDPPLTVPFGVVSRADERFIAIFRMLKKMALLSVPPESDTVPPGFPPVQCKSVKRIQLLLCGDPEAPMRNIATVIRESDDMYLQEVL